MRLKEYALFVVLPVLLALLFVLQNYCFNVWIGLNPGIYLSRFLAVNFGLGLLIYSPALLFKKWGRLAYLLIAAVCVSLIFASQFLYFSYAQSFLQISALKYVGQLGSVKGTVKTLLSWQLFVFFINFFAVAPLFLRLQKKYEALKLDWREIAGTFLVILAVAFYGYYFLVHKEDQQWGNASNLYKDVYDLNTLVEKVGIVNFSLEDAVKYAAESGLVSQQDQTFMEGVAKTMPVPTQGKTNFGLEKRKNIIFLQVESLEAGVINDSLNGNPITPNLNALASQGLYFNNYYTQVGPGNTADAEFSTLDSLYPLPDDVAFVDYPHNTYHALPSLLDSMGYGTYSLHADVPTFWNRANMYPSLGYQTQFSEDDYVKSRPIGEGPSNVGDEDFLMQSLTKMQTFKEPFMATLITISSHTPFILPQDLQTLPIPANTTLNETQQQYLESVHYSDKAIGEFIAALQQTPIYDNSIIFIYGDHGSFTNISQALGDANQFPGLENSQVPLIILAPGTNLTGVETIPASHIDLYPTITNLLGVKTPQGIFGQDIFNTKTPVVTHRNLFSGNINTIVTNNLAYQASSNGVFADGTCYVMPGKVATSVNACKSVYDQQNTMVQASDIIIRGNLLNDFIKNEPK